MPSVCPRGGFDSRAPHHGRRVNIVIGFRPELWRSVAPNDTPAKLTDSMSRSRAPRDTRCRQRRRSVAMDRRSIVRRRVRPGSRCGAKLAPYAKSKRELDGWSYRHSRDLTASKTYGKPGTHDCPRVATIPTVNRAPPERFYSTSNGNIKHRSGKRFRMTRKSVSWAGPKADSTEFAERRHAGRLARVAYDSR